MKIHQNRKGRLGVIAGAVLLLTSLLVVSPQSLTFGRELVQESSDKRAEPKPMCPMMAGLKGIKLTADSPPLLMARADELKLTEQQKQELKSIADEAQRKAANVLTADQKAMLGESPHKSMSMMEIAMMRSKDRQRDNSGEMCPMCKKKMEEMMKKKMMKGEKSDEENSKSR